MKIQNQLGYIKGITFAPFHKRGSLSTQTARDSFDYMIEHTAADFIILAPVGLQDHAHSEEICYTSSATFSDEELINMIRYAKSKRIRVALKPTVNCKMVSGVLTSVSLKKMFRVNRNGKTGLPLTQNSRHTMPKLQKPNNVIFLLQDVRW